MTIRDDNVVVGFTGTRKGMTPAQRAMVTSLIEDAIGADNNVCRRGFVGVHGDCIGADEQFDDVCHELGVATGIRPCTFHNMRARCDQRRPGVTVLAEAKRPMARNRDIVGHVGGGAEGSLLIACPPNFERIKKGSGTWATVGFGERARVRVVVVFPDGRTWEPER